MVNDIAKINKKPEVNKGELSIDKESYGRVLNNKSSIIEKSKKWSSQTFLITKDSMLGYIDQNRMSGRYKVKVQPFPGAAPLLEKLHDPIVLHVIINDSVNHEASVIIQNFLKSKNSVLTKLPKC